MTKLNRIRKDKKILVNNNYKRPRIHKAFNYFKDWENAVMIYVCESGKDTHIKYSMPKHFNIDKLYNDLIKPKLSAPVKNLDMEYKETGAVYNVVLMNNKVAYASVKPDLSVHYKEVDFNGKTNRMDA